MKTALKDILRERGISQGAFADQLDLSRGYMSLLVNGQRDPSPDTLKQIADALQITVAELIEGETKSANGMAEPAVRPIGLPDNRKSQILSGMGIRARTAEVMEVQRYFPTLSLQPGDLIAVDLKYNMTENALMLMNVIDHDGNMVTEIGRWLSPWFVFADSTLGPRKKDNSGEVAVMGRVLASSRSY